MSPATTIAIRRANLNDRQIISQIRTRSIRGLAATHYTNLQIEAWSEPKSVDQYPVETEYIIVAEVDGVITGYGDLRMQRGEVRAIYVDANYARMGIGSKILNHLEKTSKESGLSEVRLGASLNAVSFYKQHGYTITKLNCKMIANGVESPYCAMTKRLGSLGD